MSDKIERSTVSLVRCDSYDRSDVEDALRKGLNYIGGLGSFIKAGQKVLLKPNIIAGCHPDRAATTHPEVLRAVINEVLALGAFPVVGDSPGLDNMHNAMDKCKYTEVLKDTGVEAVEFEPVDHVTIESGKILKSMRIAKIALEADAIINLPKLKTHGLTTYTGCIKNMFGTICGKEKAQMHMRFQGIELFSEMLVDLYTKVKPVINIMDGIVAMEGDGPSNGTPKKLSLLLIGEDGVAVDTVACKIIGTQIKKVPPVHIASTRNIGVGDIDSIDVLGDELSSFVPDTFEIPNAKKMRFSLLKTDGKWGNFLKSIGTSKPIVLSECKLCGKCKAVCPASAITFQGDRKIATIDHRKCIRCFCCQELCPFNAIKIKTPVLARVLK